ncbi:serine/threonine-protein kinase [Streptomyces sp. SID5785]|uniref:serine/threonine-protein kinase n=1 Tax=Streptomyces sp. SID5785 TaxID=2690309 RepID=UPI001F45386F|nr:serine/threonine-protein kinase [Streptomyces sp. SID5785]
MPRSHDHTERGPALVEPLEPTDPQRVGPYLLLGRLGSGGMGRVFLARSESGRTVAVKVVHEELTSDRRFRARFRREVEAAGRVDGGYTARVLASDHEAPRPWVATAYVPGASLEQTVSAFGPLEADALRTLADGLLHTLAAVHEAGVVHRDLKPSNVMLTADGPRVIDFGIARAVETSVESLLTSTGSTIGTPGFMAPEQVRGEEVGTGADVFALGCVLVWAHTGRLAHAHGSSNAHALMYGIAEQEPDLSLIRDEDLRSFVARCLIKDPAERPDVATLLAETSWTGRTAWLTPTVLTHLARQTALLLEVEAPEDVPAPESEAGTGEEPGGVVAPPVPADRDTFPLRPAAPTPDDGKPTPGSGRAAAPDRTGRLHGRTAWIVLAAVVAVLLTSGTVYYFVSERPDSSDVADGSGAGTPAPSATRSAATASPSASSSKGGGKKKDRKDDRKDGTDGEDGAGKGGGSGDDAAPSGSGGSAGAAEGDEANVPADDAQGGGSGSGGSGGGSGGGSSTAGGVPAYFVGTWKAAMPSYGGWPPDHIVVRRAAKGEQAVTFVTANGYPTCTYVARLVSVENGGKRLNLGEGNPDESRSGAGCQVISPSYLDADAPSSVDYFQDQNQTVPGNASKYTRS